MHVIKHSHYRRRPHAHKVAVLLTTQDVSDWNRTLQLGQKAKDMGIIIAVTARFGDGEDEAKFQKLASTQRLAFFANDEKEHLRTMHNMIDQKLECEYLFEQIEW